MLHYHPGKEDRNSNIIMKTLRPNLDMQTKNGFKEG